MEPPQKRRSNAPVIRHEDSIPTLMTISLWFMSMREFQMRGRVEQCICLCVRFLYEADTQTLVLTGQSEEPAFEDNPFTNTEVTL